MDQVLIQTAFLGDLLLSIPLIHGLKKFQPELNLHLVCRENLGDLFIKLGLIDQVWEVSKINKNQSYNKLVEDLKTYHFNYLWCPHESFRSAMLVSKIKSKNKIGFKHLWNSVFFTDRVLRPMNWPEALRQLSLLGILDSKLSEELSMLSDLDNPKTLDNWSHIDNSKIPEFCSMNLKINKALSVKIIESIEKHSQELIAKWKLATKEYVIVSPGSVWATKMWTQDGYSELISNLIKQGMKVILSGTQQEFELCESIKINIHNNLNVLNLAGKLSIYELFCLMWNAKFFVGNDSGAMHLASAAGLPSVVMFGPTTLNLGYRPWNENSYVVQKPLPCRPCGQHGSQACPLNTHECMKSISSADVITAINKIT